MNDNAIVKEVNSFMKRLEKAVKGFDPEVVYVCCIFKGLEYANDHPSVNKEELLKQISFIYEGILSIDKMIEEEEEFKELREKE